MVSRLLWLRVLPLAASGGPARPRAFALVGVCGFALLEHVERLAHGELPWLLTSPA